MGDIRALIDAAKKKVSRTVNTGLVSLYWSIGKRIEQDILQNKKADYGREIFQTLSGKLVAQRFKPEFKGQMELYLRWLDKHERRERFSA